MDILFLKNFPEYIQKTCVCVCIMGMFHQIIVGSVKGHNMVPIQKTNISLLPGKTLQEFIFLRKIFTNTQRKFMKIQTEKYIQHQDDLLV